ncbi:TetR/AcrR family transcriptional regulator [Corynebacterium lubricantis]|uniref:TetR/AcrR family transcriptional regulator n=1 Tax=Corynebacterium lubricantis TaxID=541095 RepID=UPI0003800424|nr:TetR/AcrR family transcriptional regulator [Corynebacterium lubricantis]
MLTPRQRMLFTNIYSDFLAEGFSHFTVDGAASKYQCSKATIYALGKSRDDIVRRVLVAYFQEIGRRTDAVINSARTSHQALTAYFNEMAVATAPASAQFWADMAGDKVATDVYSFNTKAAVERITRLIKAGISSGEFRAADPDFIATMIDAAMFRIQNAKLPNGVSTPEAYSELGKLVLNGISAERK